MWQPPTTLKIFGGISECSRGHSSAAVSILLFLSTSAISRPAQKQNAKLVCWRRLVRSPHGTPNFVLGASNYHHAWLVTRVHKPDIAKPRKPRNLSTMWISRISWFPKSKKSMSKSTIIECALDGEIHKIHEIQINRTHPLCTCYMLDLRCIVRKTLHCAFRGVGCDAGQIPALWKAETLSLHVLSAHFFVPVGNCNTTCWTDFCLNDNLTSWSDSLITFVGWLPQVFFIYFWVF